MRNNSKEEMDMRTDISQEDIEIFDKCNKRCSTLFFQQETVTEPQCNNTQQNVYNQKDSQFQVLARI